ncbi:MAG: hypothetical protein IPO92_24390 [Saprospiraceae bacterium]|nr:hypothetical protein [Saprospiraceae bacterium]
MTTDVGIISSGQVSMGVVNISPGQAQARIYSKNFRGDFTQPTYTSYNFTI